MQAVSDVSAVMADIDPLLKLEMSEEWKERMVQLWASGVPLCLAPEGDGDDDGDGDDEGDSDDDTGGSGDGDDDDDDDDDKPVTKAEFKKVMSKLRDAEKREAAANKKLRQAERKDLSDQARAEAERDEAIKERDEAKAAVEAAERDKDIVSIAKALKFKKIDTDHLRRFVGADSKDLKSIKADLKEALKDIPELAGPGGSTPPPVDDANSESGKGSNSSMNRAIRAAAGRRVA